MKNLSMGGGGIVGPVSPVDDVGEKTPRVWETQFSSLQPNVAFGCDFSRSTSSKSIKTVSVTV